MSNVQSPGPFRLLIAHCSLLIAHWRPRNGRFMERLHALSSTHWDHEPERGRSPAAARRQLGGLRKTRTPWSWRERCARGPGALRVQRFMGSSLSLSDHDAPITDSGFRDDEFWLGRIGFNFFAQVGDVDAEVMGLLD